MIYKNGKIILEIQKDILELVDKVEEQVQKKIGAIYKGSQLVWLSIYNAIRSCFGSGIWLPDKPWLQDDTWRNN